MRRSAPAWLLAAAAAGCASLGARSDARYHFDFTLGPVRGQYQTFACSATATEAETSVRYTAPDARARLGEQAKTSGDEAPPYPHLEITLESEPSGRTVTCRAALYVGAKLLGDDRTILRQ